MENNDEFKKKLEELAKQREAKLKQIADEEILARTNLVELRKKRITAFETYRTNVAYQIIRDTKQIFEKTGDSILVWDNERADTLADKMRRFFQIFYYPKGRPSNIVGKNTSSLTFELNENNGEVKISQAIKPVFSIPVIEVVSVESLNKDLFQEKLFRFLEKVSNQ